MLIKVTLSTYQSELAQVSALRRVEEVSLIDLDWKCGGKIFNGREDLCLLRWHRCISDRSVQVGGSGVVKEFVHVPWDENLHRAIKELHTEGHG